MHNLRIGVLAAAALAGNALPLAGKDGVNPPGKDESVLFEQMPVVEAASLHSQTLQEAPANVTVITDDEIRSYGYRTLGEALASARGFYSTYDHIYHYIGVRGFSIPGDYNTRFLVMLNGHPLTEHSYDSNGFFGQDFGLDMDLVRRIEIIRGPSSALYGSNGILATINIVTKSPVDYQHGRVSTEIGSFGEKKVQLSSALYLGRGANLLVSASLIRNGGQSLYFPEYDTPETNRGWADGVDGERAFHTFANLIWHDWSFTAYLNNRQKAPPVGWGDAMFGDRGNRTRDSRNFAAAAYKRTVGDHGKLQWQLSYDNYLYDDRFDYAVEDHIEDARSGNRNDWVGSQLRYQFPVPKIGDLTLGVEADFEFRNLLYSFVASPVYREILNANHPDRRYALFAQDEISLSRRWKASLGLRFDATRIYQSSLSPRLAIIHQPSPETTYKFVYGRPFRNPSTNEQFYTDNGLSFIASPPLRNETAHTFEVSAEHRIRRDLTGIVNAYYYHLDHVIEAVFLPGDVQQYLNNGHRRSKGVEFELSGKPWGRLEATGSFVVQSAINSGTGQVLSNAPGRIAQVRFAVPVAHNKLYLSSATQYQSTRYTHDEAPLRPVLLSDFTATTVGLHPNFDLQAGVRNLFGWNYQDPVYLALDRMQGNGRSVFLRLVCHTSE